MSMQIYLQNLPVRLANYYYGCGKFFLEAEQVKNLEHSLLIYASALLTREKMGPYESLLQAAARQIMAKLSCLLTLTLAPR
jgi:hypothetical protein